MEEYYLTPATQKKLRVNTFGNFFVMKKQKLMCKSSHQ